eukprot:TRINITY_DN6939_c0_g1_i1.p1 TRINITY_DN6939_c0_g1~~TRINITY_DN6939_c0_g1_i1.p1  ORF type:complete len:211 (+),score=42.25 TRINITY_DN6939_c0_g1_i1:219-851(+)
MGTASSKRAARRAAEKAKMAPSETNKSTVEVPVAVELPEMVTGRSPQPQPKRDLAATARSAELEKLQLQVQLESDKIKRDQAMAIIKGEIAKAATEVIKQQLKVCCKMLELEGNRAKAAAELCSSGVHLVKQPDTHELGLQLLHQAAAMPPQLTAPQCLQAMREVLQVCPAQFERLVAAALDQAVITPAQVDGNTSDSDSDSDADDDGEF